MAIRNPHRKHLGNGSKNDLFVNLHKKLKMRAQKSSREIKDIAFDNKIDTRYILGIKTYIAHDDLEEDYLRIILKKRGDGRMFLYKGSGSFVFKITSNGKIPIDLNTSDDLYFIEMRKQIMGFKNYEIHLYS
ncbi:MAG TPA: hypothetical protein VJH34_00250 [archaeon]|nr:hypothetical protein [archaeon]